MSEATSPELWARLRSFADQPTEYTSPLRTKYRQQAAVLAWFDDEQSVSRVATGPQDPEFLEFLSEDCDRILGADGERHWAVKDSIRRSALAELAAVGALRTT